VSRAGQQLRLDDDGVVVNSIWWREIWCDIILSVWVSPHYTLAVAGAAATDDDDDDDFDTWNNRHGSAVRLVLLPTLVIMTDCGSWER